MFDGDTSEYYGGTYPSPYDEDEDEREEEFDYGDYIDYCYESYRDDCAFSQALWKDKPLVPS